PLDLRAGEVGRQRQAHPLLVLVSTLVAPELVADALGTGVLPDDRVVDRLTGGLVPHHGGLALVGDAHGRQPVAVDVGAHQPLAGHVAGVPPARLRVVLVPAGLREDLLVLLLPAGDDLAGVVEDDRAGRGGALVDGHDVHGLVVHRNSFVGDERS